MLNWLLLYRTPIATILGVSAAAITFLEIDVRWYFAVPISFAVMLATAVLWGVFLGVCEQWRLR